LLSYFLSKNIERVTEDKKGYDIATPSLSHAKKTGISTHEIQYFINPDAPHPNFRPILSVKFPPPVTKKQFRSLQRTYGKWSSSRSRVCFNRTIALEIGYDILDFLPPIMQATWGHRFQPEDEFGPAPLHYQCYGFLLDVLSIGMKRRRQGRFRSVIQLLINIIRLKTKSVTTAPRLTISTPDSRSVFETLTTKSKLISEGFNLTNSHGEDDNIQPGDVILIFHDNSGKFERNQVWLDHIVMYIDDGLLFEKSGSGKGTVFRLLDYATFEKSWASLPGLFRMQVRRPDPKNPIDVVQDLTLQGSFSLQEVQNFLSRNHPSEEKNLHSISIPSLVDELCGSYDEDTDRITFTSVMKMKEELEVSNENGRSRLPKSSFVPMLFSERNLSIIKPQIDQL